MKYKLYQIQGNEHSLPYLFTGKRELQKFNLWFPPPRAFYKKVYEGECESIDPDKLFELHNRDDRPARTRIRSMSVSDVIVYEWENKRLALFCDSYTFLSIRFPEEADNGDICWHIPCTYFVRDGYAYVLLERHESKIEIQSDHLLGGATHFKDQSGEMLELDASEIYAILHTILSEQSQVKYNQVQKTYEGWTSSGAAFDNYVNLNDEVDKEIVNNFLEMLPPAYHTPCMVQMGEPNEHLPDGRGNFRATYMTFERVSDKWYYRGYCFEGERQNRHRFPSFHEIYARLVK